MEFYVVLLAGGQSSRFWPLEEKNLFEFFGVPLLVYQIKRYSHFFSRTQHKPRFIVVSNQNNYDLITKHLQSYKIGNLQVVIQTLPDQAGAIISALNKASKPLPLLVINSNDIFNEVLIVNFLKQLEANKIMLTGSKVNSYLPGGYLLQNKQGGIKTIVEKPQPETVPSQYNLFRFVLDYFPNQNLLASILKNNQDNLGYEDAINLLLLKSPAKLVLNDLDFAILKYPWHILKATKIFLNSLKENIVKTQELDKTAQIIGKVFISEGVKIGSFTKIVGPVYIGKNTVIGDYCLVRQSHLGSGCLIGAGSEVTRSYLGNKVMLHRNYVGDSILSHETRMGANAITANWRFNEHNVKSFVKQTGQEVDTELNKLGLITGEKVKIGVGCCLMPGVKIRKAAIVFPNETVYKDIL